MIEIEIRQETPEDYSSVENIVQQSFLNEEFSDHCEHLLVRRLRESSSFVPELSLVAEYNQEIIGYILFTEIPIGEQVCLALAPLAILPDYQNHKIGGSLIKEGHLLAKKLGYPVSVVMGHAEYYPRFGYIPASEFGIRSPFEVSSEDFLAVELLPNTIQHISSLVQYSSDFCKESV